MENQNYLTPAQFGQIMARAWLDADFREELESDPTSTIKGFALSELGIEVSKLFQVPYAPDDLDRDSLEAIITGGEKLMATSARVCI